MRQAWVEAGKAGTHVAVEEEADPRVDGRGCRMYSGGTVRGRAKGDHGSGPRSWKDGVALCISEMEKTEWSRFGG